MSGRGRAGEIKSEGWEVSENLMEQIRFKLVSDRAGKKRGKKDKKGGAL